MKFLISKFHTSQSCVWFIFSMKICVFCGYDDGLHICLCFYPIHEEGYDSYDMLSYPYW